MLQVVAVNTVILVSILLAVLFRDGIRVIICNIFSLWVALIIITKLVYQINYIDDKQYWKWCQVGTFYMAPQNIVRILKNWPNFN